MRLLGEAADRQAPALANLRDSAPQLRRFFDNLGPFSDASRPAFRTLAEAAEIGRSAVRAARPNVAELRKGVEPLPEAAANLAITLEHLDDPKYAIEKDPRAPRPARATPGWSTLLRYIHNQGQATNIFDANGYLLKVSAFLDNTCAPYADAEAAKDPALDKCAAILGPNRPGINQPDPSKKSARNASVAREARIVAQALRQLPSEPRARTSARVRLLDYFLGT